MTPDGGQKTETVDVRILAATHRDLESEIAEGRFREDLFYRLEEFPIVMPPLRERLEDLGVLVKTLISRLENERGTVQIGKPVLDALRRYHWPGNVRELSNTVERLRVLHRGGVAEIASLPEKILGAGAPAAGALARGDDAPAAGGESAAHLPDEGLDLKEYLAGIELYLIREALDRSGGVVAQAAKLLGLGRTTLVEKMRKYSL